MMSMIKMAAREREREREKEKRSLREIPRLWPWTFTDLVQE